ncbi:c(7)-type cytochrome triheme domain-containing protein [Desulfobulbus sp.]|uniref:c(7)-type cytochrome triheme domain-containing protein n=1 Tax=Desulfobulbus sp. TaxID=895 RepID=UPI00286ED9F4|nr:c(7)-type cytochrome triheme domain-containing protein [Desulfobulbus sp.]
MKMKTLLMAALWVVAVAGTSMAADKQAAPAPAPAGSAAPAKQYESFGNTQIVEMEPVKQMFSHKAHVVTAGLTCDSCHPSLFERKWGAAKAKGDYNMASLDAGKYCGACHDGSTAFNTTGPETCKKCHGSDMKQPDVIVFNRPVKGVVFTHKAHVDMGLDCASCHDKAFEMRKGAAEEELGKFNMRALYAGKYCGVCHNGNIAFASNTRCTSCHIGVKGVEKMLNKAAAAAEEKAQH